MTDTTTERRAGALGPAAYRVTATRVYGGEDPYLVLECPHECVSKLLHGRYRASADLGTLVMAAINHDRRHTVTEPDQVPELLREQIAELGDYRLYPDLDTRPFLLLNCPYLKSPDKTMDARRCPDTVDGQCVANLLPEQASLAGVELGELLRLAAEHEAARARALAEQLGAGARAKLVGHLAALRQIWAGRQQEALYTRDTADSPSAGIAGARADLIGQLLADLDKAVAGG
ncbi:hypothetical protein OHA25_08640 [Nonomuraea sp. NBC_00507]|uniref:hypothetical protein n=1 Tax=Nonomuraea sp. NBC_00507 TaxID=2976002 RepID=UPI002E170611